MKLVKKRDNASDSDYVESEVLFKGTSDKLESLAKEINSLKTYVLSDDNEAGNGIVPLNGESGSEASKKGLKAILKELQDKPARLPIEKGILDLSAPINIASLPEIEERENRAGVCYYDVVNDRFRLCTIKGWKTIKLG